MDLATLLLQHEVDQLNARYAASLDEKRYNDWPEFFVEDALYKVQARENFDRLQKDGILVREGKPCMYLYRQVIAGHSQTGLVTVCHTEDYVCGWESSYDDWMRWLRRQA